jgi:DNA-directed RNA polymerase specialized sigma24 family protein
VALSAINSFCVAAAAGRFPRLDDRDDLWQVLFVITTRKAIGLVRHHTRQKRGGNRNIHGTSVPSTDSTPDALAAAVAAGPSPGEVAEVTEACGRLLGLLDEEKLRPVAMWKMEGYTNAEIAVKLDRSVPAVERKLATIRAIWERKARH